MIELKEVMTTGEAEALDRDIRADVRLFRGVQVRLGRKLLRVRRNDLVLSMGATTFAIYSEKIGLSAQEGRDMADIAQGACSGGACSAGFTRIGPDS